jgi:predicted metal-dependent RNase
MKIIIISNRKYRQILERLTEMEDVIRFVREMAPAMKEMQKSGFKDDAGEVYVDSEKVCELLCISGRTLLRLCKTHKIKSKRVSHRCYYPFSEIEKLFTYRSISFDKEVRERLMRECNRIKEQNNIQYLENHELH